MDLGEGGKKRKGGANAAGGPSLLEDDRFKAMFEDPEFAIDERSAEWKLLHPNTGRWQGGTETGVGGSRAEEVRARLSVGRCTTRVPGALLRLEVGGRGVHKVWAPGVLSQHCTATHVLAVPCAALLG